MKIIVSIIPADLVTNSLLSYFCPFLQTKSKYQVFSKLVVWLQEIFCFLFIASRALLQRHTEFNRILKRNFLTCYSCSYYSSMFIFMFLKKKIRKQICNSFNKVSLNIVFIHYILLCIIYFPILIRFVVQILIISQLVCIYIKGVFIKIENSGGWIK